MVNGEKSKSGMSRNNFAGSRMPRILYSVRNGTQKDRNTKAMGM